MSRTRRAHRTSFQILRRFRGTLRSCSPGGPAAGPAGGAFWPTGDSTAGGRTIAPAAVPGKAREFMLLRGRAGGVPGAAGDPPVNAPGPDQRKTGLGIGLVHGLGGAVSPA